MNWTYCQGYRTQSVTELMSVESYLLNVQHNSMWLPPPLDVERVGFSNLLDVEWKQGLCRIFCVTRLDTIAFTGTTHHNDSRLEEQALMILP
ncbi:uncharacterized protein L203_101553 [Cryptococcus depauperatus CBS 7841]|uniref:Uncharacterized protein n=1 Tax=Cryptococcus depauperatus CBS 7841 TaxID=1295531 RepID=A0AAJ8JQ97_9TREE